MTTAGAVTGHRLDVARLARDPDALDLQRLDVIVVGSGHEPSRRDAATQGVRDLDVEQVRRNGG